MEDLEIGAKEQQMLELLADGASSRRMAEALGYRDGTMRVYLHHLYRKLGVANRAEAASWYVKRTGALAPRPVARSSEAPTNDLVGEMALREGLYGTLGAMSAFLGPFSKTWEVAQRMRGAKVDDALVARRDTAREFWRALLLGDFALGKSYADDHAKRLHADPSNATLLIVLLRLGGYSGAADRLTSQIRDRRRIGPTPSARELALLDAVEEAVDAQAAKATSGIERLATERTANPSKHIAMAVLFHAWRSRRDAARARAAANTLWTEAELARRQLEAMGERYFAAPGSTEAPTTRARRSKIRTTA